MRFKLKEVLSAVLAVCMMSGPAAYASDLPPSMPASTAYVEAEPTPAETTLDESPETTEDASKETVSEAPLIQPEETASLEADGSPDIEKRASAVPNVMVLLQSYDVKNCIMDVRVSGASAGSRITLAVWPVRDPGLLHEYSKRAVSSREVSFRVPLADFDMCESTYTFEARIDGVPAASTDGSMYAMRGVIEAVPTQADESEYQITLRGASLPGDPRVWFVVTDQSTGRAVLCRGTSGENGPTCTLMLRHLPSVGTYKVTAYAALRSGCLEEVNSGKFAVNGVTSSELQFTDINGSDGTFRVQLAADTPAGADRVTFSVWTEPDESDLREFEVPVNGTSIKADVQTGISDFSGAFGTYCARAVVSLSNGRTDFIGKTQAEIAPHNYLTTESIPGTTDRRITVLGADPADASAFRFVVRPAESEDIGTELAAQQGEDGSVYAVLETSALDGAGTYNVLVQANGTDVGTLSIELSAKDFTSEAEQRIARDVQRVYNMVGTDLHDNYMWVVNNFSYVRRDGHLTPPAGYTRGQWYAVEGLEKQSGNCYTFAGAFCELAKGLGYDAQYVEAEIYGTTRGWQPHGIVLVRQNDATYICDPETQFASSSGRNLYMQPASNPKAKYRW